MSDALEGQLATELADGSLVLSCGKPVEDGARVALLLASGLFRLDVSPHEDTLRIVVRNLSGGRCSWAERGAGRDRSFRIEVGGHRADVLIAAQREPATGIVHFTAHATVVRISDLSPFSQRATVSP